MSEEPRSRPNGRERAAAILAEVQRAGFASITALSEALDVSDMTIRRDVRRLARDGELRVVHGGVSIPHGTLRTAGFAGRAEQESVAKRSIAEAAVAMLDVDSTIALDAGTTCVAVAAALPREFHGSVVTHSVPVLQQMLDYPQATVICLGGELLVDSQALIGPRTTAAAEALTVDTFFLGANSVDERGIYLRGDRERPVKTALMAGASRVVLLADATKFAHTAPVRLAELEAVTTVLTNGPVPPALAERCAGLGVEVVLAN